MPHNWILQTRVSNLFCVCERKVWKHTWVLLNFRDEEFGYDTFKTISNLHKGTMKIRNRLILKLLSSSCAYDDVYESNWRSSMKPFRSFAISSAYKLFHKI